MTIVVPELIQNRIGGAEVAAVSGRSLAKYNPHDGTVLYDVACSDESDVARAVEAAKGALPSWRSTSGIARGAVLTAICNRLEEHKDEIAAVVARETGKSMKDSLGETSGAILLGRFFAGEGQRLFGRTMPTSQAEKHAMTIREPMGVAGLIIAANTPIANVAWKAFPAMICGNTSVMKAAEDAPATAWIFAKLAEEAGLPAGVLNLVHGYGHEAGAPLVNHRDVAVVSFTGSSAVGREIAENAAKRLAKVSLELGGKNPFVVCDDADLDRAVEWAALSIYSNAGQRCSSAGRIIVFDAVYEVFREKLIERTKALPVGPGDDDFLGPVINQRQLDNMVGAIERAIAGGATLLIGGGRLEDAAHRGGYYMAPTLLENVDPNAEISTRELFGPIGCLYRVKDFGAAIALANSSDYGLTACIHTRNVNRANIFTREVAAGVAVINAGTYGSEPHMPFGGVGDSGNGSREPGTEALDVYSSLKVIYTVTDAGDL